MNKDAKQFLDLGHRVVLVTAEDNPRGLFFQEFSQSGSVAGWQKKGNKRLYIGEICQKVKRHGTLIKEEQL